MSPHPEFLCCDCGFDTLVGHEYYMLTDALWAQIGMDEGMLCIGCVESRLGRRLVPNDFPPYPINLGVFTQSPRLAQRCKAVISA